MVGVFLNFSENFKLYFKFDFFILFKILFLKIKFLIGYPGISQNQYMQIWSLRLSLLDHITYITPHEISTLLFVQNVDLGVHLMTCCQGYIVFLLSHKASMQLCDLCVCKR